MIKDLLHQLQKRREEEDETRELIEEMQRKLGRVLGNTWTLLKKEMGRPQHIMNKMWQMMQMMQSRDTTNLNLDKDFEEIMSKMNQAGWNESRTKMRTVVSGALCSSCMMEGTMTLVAECLRADVRLCQRMAIQRLPVRSDRPSLERSVGWLAKISVRKEGPAL